MAHELHRFSKSVLSVPQLMEPSRFEEVAELLEDRNSGLFQMAIDASKESVSMDSIKVENGIAVLNLEGATTYKPTLFQALCGGVSYQMLLQQMNTVVNMPNVHTILMNVDGPGGQAFRMMSTGKQLRKIADNAGKKLIAYVDGTSASATYGLTVAAHEVIAHPESSVGSVGVVLQLANTNKRDKEEGIEKTYITAGSEKIPFDKHGDFREGFLEDLQNKVDKLYTGFTSYVSEMRGIDVQVVKDTEAKMFQADEALELGLIDKVMEAEDFYAYLGVSEVSSSSPSQGAGFQTKNSTGEVMSENEKPVEKLEEIVEAVEATTEEKLDTEEVEAVETVVEAVTEEAATVELSAEQVEMAEQLEAMKAEMAELKELQAAQLAKQEVEKAELAAQIKETKMASLVEEASLWAFAGIDAQAYATEAINGSVSVEMFSAAMAKAQETLNASEAMQELGASVEEQPETKKVDGVEAALAANKNVKLKNK
jgi:signal peptide peptidase SppA